MDEVPLTVTVAIPTHIGQQFGRYATTPPHGYTTSFRAPDGVIEAVDRARALIDPELTRNMFMQLAVKRVAEAICKHHDDYLKWVEEHRNHGHRD